MRKQNPSASIGVSLLKQLPLLFCAFLIAAHPAAIEAAEDDEKKVDLGILERRDELSQHMTREQKVRMVRAEERIDSGRSDIRRGKYMTERPKSELNPDEDIKSVREKGESLINRGEEKVREGRRRIARLLHDVAEKREAELARESVRFDFSLPESGYDAFLKEAVDTLLDSGEKEGYESILFNGVFVSTETSVRKAVGDLHNEAYDKVVGMDEDRFNITVPTNFRITAESSENGGYVFDFDNRDTFDPGKTALLVVELVGHSGADNGILSVRLIGLRDQRIVATRTSRVSGVERFLYATQNASTAREAEETTAGGKAEDKKETAEDGESPNEARSEQTDEAAGDGAAGDSAPEREQQPAKAGEKDSGEKKQPTPDTGPVAENGENAPEKPKRAPVARGLELRDPERYLKQFERLSTPYRFAVETDAVESPLRSRLLQNLLKHTLVQNSKLILVDTDFIEQAYVPDPDSFPKEGGAENAVFRIKPVASGKEEEDAGAEKEGNAAAAKDADANGEKGAETGRESFKLTAKARDRGQSVEIGTLTLKTANPSSGESGKNAKSK